MKRANPRIPATERRQQIMAVATELFARQGFHGTTTREIAGKVGVKEIILFRIFPTKQDLYWAVIEAKCAAAPGIQGLKQLLASGNDDHAIFSTLAANLIERNLNDPTLMRLLLFSALEAHDLTERFTQTYMLAYYDVLTTFIRRRIRAGIFREVEPVIAARSFLGMVNHYLLVQELFGGKRHLKYDNRLVAETLTTIWLEGMRTK